MEAATTQRKNGLRADRLSCGNTARIEFVMLQASLQLLWGCIAQSGGCFGVVAMQSKNDHEAGNCAEFSVMVTCGGWVRALRKSTLLYHSKSKRSAAVSAAVVAASRRHCEGGRPFGKLRAGSRDSRQRLPWAKPKGCRRYKGEPDWLSAWKSRSRFTSARWECSSRPAVPRRAVQLPSANTPSSWSAAAVR